jgi:chromosome segregation ATPase
MPVDAQSKTFFRYENEQGSKVMTDAIPPQYAVKGYEVINSSGIVIKVVPPEPSPEEKARIQKEKAEKRRLEKWDKELLSRYSSVNDIESTKSRRITGLENSIFSLRLTLKNISETIKFYQAEAATHERQGEDVSADTLASIERLQNDRDFIEAEISKKDSSKTQVSNDYDKDIVRFKQIKPERKYIP